MAVLIMDDGRTVSGHGLLLDDTNELKGAAERGVWVRPFRALEMSHLQDVVVLSHTEERCKYKFHNHEKKKHQVQCSGGGAGTCVASKMKSWMMICSSLERHSLSLLMSVTVKAMQFMASSRLGQ